MKKHMVRVVIASIAIVLAFVYGVRVWQINEADKANAVPVERYAMGEWVDLTGSFFTKRSPSS